MARVDGRSAQDRSGTIADEGALTAPRVWAGLIALCVLVAAGCVTVAAWLRSDGDGDPLADALVVFAAVFLVATLCAACGFAFSAARGSLADAHAANSARSALGASIVVFVTALLGGCVAASASSDDGLELDPIPADAGMGAEWDQVVDPAGTGCDVRTESC